MAVVGEAHVIVRALTDKVSGDIQKGFSGANATGKKAGESMGQAFSRGFNKGTNTSMLTNLSNGIKTAIPDAVKMHKAFQLLNAAGMTLGTTFAQLIGGLFSVVGGLVSVGGAALGAAASVAALGPIFVGAALAMLSTKLALSGVGKALAALNKQAISGSGAAQAIADAQAREAAARRVEDAERSLAQVIEDNRTSLVDANNEVRDAQLELNKAIVKGQEEIQQLGFDAEDAALSESKAALELDKARETLARTQDLPPNSRARKEAQLAYQEAELNLRKAKDKSADLNKEQNRLAKSGVAGTNAVISANQRLAQAEAAKAKTVQTSLRQQADAERNLADAKRAQAEAAAKADAGGGADPLAGLNEAQVAFVRFIQTIMPKLTELKAAVSAAFLPPLQEAITTLMDGMFPTVEKGMVQIATATGEAAKKFATMAAEGRNVGLLQSIFTGVSGIISQLGATAGSAFGIALSLLNAAIPLANTFVGFLNGKLLSFDEYLKSDTGQKKLNEFFTKSGAAAAQFGEILGNTLGAIGNIIMANLGPGTGGQIMLDWLTQVTQGWQDMGTKGVAGVGTLSEYFVAVANNAKSVLGFIGTLLGELMKLGADASIATTFDALKGAVPTLGDILKSAIAAGPALAELVGHVLNIIKAFTDTAAIEIFFGILNDVAGVIESFLQGNKGIVDFIGYIGAAAAAFTVMGKLGTFAFKATAGAVAQLSGGIGGIIDVTKGFAKNGLTGGLDAIKSKFGETGGAKDDFMKNLGLFDGKLDETVTKTGGLTGAMDSIKGSFGKAGDGLKSFGGMVSGGLSTAFSSMGGMFSTLGSSIGSFGKMLGGFMLSPAGIVIGIIALIVGGLILLYNTSEEFRTGMDEIFAELGKTFADAGAQIMTAIQPLIPMLIGAFQQIMTALAPLIPILIGAFMQIMQAILPLIPILINALIPAIMAIITAILPLITMLITTLVPVILQVVQAFVPLITMFITQLVPVILTIIEAFVPLITMLITALVPVIVMIIEMWAALIPPILQVVTTIISILIPVFQFLIEVVVAIVVGIINAIVGFVSFIIDAFTNISNFINTVWTAIAQFFSDVWNNIVSFVTDAWNALVGFLQPAIDAFFGFWNEMWTNIGKFISDTWDNISKYVSDAWNALSKFITDGINGFMGWWNGIWEGIGSFIGTTWNRIIAYVQYYWALINAYIRVGIRIFMDWWTGIWEGIGSFIGDTWDNIVKFFKDGWNMVVNWITGAIKGFQTNWENTWNNIGNFVGDVFKNIVNGVKAPINWIIDMINGIIGSINKLKIDIPDWVPLVGGQTLSFNIPTIPHLALGGVVSPTNGGTIAKIAEAGRPERVEPLDANGMSKRDKYMMDLIRGGSGTINITVNPSAGMDESELASAISREITFQMRRGAVA